MKELIHSIFNEEAKNIKKLENGLTNDNYYFEINDQSYVIRMPGLHRPNNDYEYEILKQIEPLEISTETVYFKDGVLITKYLKENTTYKQCNYEDKIELVGQTMRKLHDSNIKVDHDFDINKLFNQYYYHAKDIADKQVEKYHYLLREVASFNNKKVLCHNDFVDGNMLFANNKMYLIDYEYAGNNDPLFDVMSFLTENNIYDENLRRRFYQQYFDNIDQKALDQLKTYEKLENMLWYYWAMMMFKHKKETIYKQIAQDKLSHLRDD